MSLTLLEFCNRTNVTVSDVARAANLNPKWLYKVAKGERGFSPETAEKIRLATGGAVTPSDLTEVRIKWLRENPEQSGPVKKNLAAEEAA